MLRGETLTSDEDRPKPLGTRNNGGPFTPSLVQPPTDPTALPCFVVSALINGRKLSSSRSSRPVLTVWTQCRALLRRLSRPLPMLSSTNCSSLPSEVPVATSPSVSLSLPIARSCADFDALDADAKDFGNAGLPPGADQDQGSGSGISSPHVNPQRLRRLRERKF